MMASHHRRIALFTTLVVFVLGAAHADTASKTLTKGDLIYLDVYRVPELTSSLQIDADGNVSLPYVGAVNIGGKTETEAASIVSLALKQILRNPRVTVVRSDALLQQRIGRTAEMMMEIVPLRNANASVLSATLEGMSTAGGKISHDPDTNTLFITDTPEALRNMIEVIGRVDRMQSQLTQVRIETKIAEVREGALKELGIRWWAQGTKLSGGFYPPGSQSTALNALKGNNDPSVGEFIGERGINATGSSRRFIDEPLTQRLNIPAHVPILGQAFVGFTSGSVDIGALIDALIADEKATLLANPMLLTVNHKTARIEMIDEFPFTEFGTEITGATNFSTKFIDLGITLEVTPHVYEDAGGTYVKMEIIPEISFPSGSINGIPIRSVRRSETVASVRDGQTLVVGGILNEEERTLEIKLPWIGDIPVIGALFKRKERSTVRTELMIFVTPTVYRHPEDVTWANMINISENMTGWERVHAEETTPEAHED